MCLNFIHWLIIECFENFVLGHLLIIMFKDRHTIVSLVTFLATVQCCSLLKQMQTVFIWYIAFHLLSHKTVFIDSMKCQYLSITVIIVLLLFSLQGYWFYALLVCLDKPLIPDACSLLRDLARACSRLRASLVSFHELQ